MKKFHITLFLGFFTFFLIGLVQSCAKEINQGDSFGMDTTKVVTPKYLEIIEYVE